MYLHSRDLELSQLCLAGMITSGYMILKAKFPKKTGVAVLPWNCRIKKAGDPFAGDAGRIESNGIKHQG